MNSRAAVSETTAQERRDQSPIRLMNVVPTFMCGGTENQFMTLGRSLDRDRFDARVCLPAAVGTAWSTSSTRAGFRCSSATSRRSAACTRFAQQRGWPGTSRRRRIDIVHAYSFYGNVFAIPPARLAGAPVVIASIRDRAPYLTPMQKRVQRLMCRFADCVLVNADAVKDWLIARRLRRLEDRRHPQRRGPRSLRRRRRLAAAPPRTRSAGRRPGRRRRVAPEPAEGARAVSRGRGRSSARRFPDARFLIVGETNPTIAPYLGELTRSGRAPGPGRSRGLRRPADRRAGAARQRHVSVMPSLNEALSNVLLESMAAGAPIVATRVGGTPEAIEDGVTGLLVPPGDRRALARRDLSSCSDEPAAGGASGTGRAAVASPNGSRSARMVACDRGTVPVIARATQPRSRPPRARSSRASSRGDTGGDSRRGRRWRGTVSMRARSRSSPTRRLRRSSRSGTMRSSAPASRIRSCATNGCARGGSASATGRHLHIVDRASGRDRSSRSRRCCARRPRCTAFRSAGSA